MKEHEPLYDITSIGVVAVVSIVAVVLIVLNLSPGEAATLSAQDADPATTLVGKAGGTACVPVPIQFDGTPFDYDGNGLLDFYDYIAVLDGRADCQAMDCDLNDDGYVDAADQGLFNLLVRELYDYDNDRVLTRVDAQRLALIMAGDASCDENMICDLDGDGRLCSDDLTLYTSLVYGYDLPIID